MKTYLHGPIDYVKNVKLRFRVGDLDVPERRKRYTSSREEEDVVEHMCPGGRTTESRTHIVGEYEIYKGERGLLEEEMRELDECDLEGFGRLESSEKTIAIPGYRWLSQAAKQDGDRISKHLV